MKRILWLFSTVMLVAGFAGCGKESPRLSVFGTVKLDGEPVKTGVITFKPLEGTNAPLVGAEFSDGKYNLTGGSGPLAGKYRVEIRSPKKSEKEIVVYPGAPPGHQSIETIPSAYNSKSTLQVEISKTSQEHNFELSSANATTAEQKKKK